MANTLCAHLFWQHWGRVDILQKSRCVNNFFFYLSAWNKLDFVWSNVLNSFDFDTFWFRWFQIFIDCWLSFVFDFRLSSPGFSLSIVHCRKGFFYICFKIVIFQLQLQKLSVIKSHDLHSNPPPFFHVDLMSFFLHRCKQQIEWKLLQ